MRSEREGRLRAEQFRKEHHLGAQPLGDLFALFELVPQLDVASITVEDPNEHGMTACDTARGAVKVIVASTPHPMRQRGTLAHELAHVLFRDYETAPNGGWADRSPEEVRADAFARHLLVPLDGLRAIVVRKRTPTLGDLSMLVQRFQASPALIAIQMELGGHITADVKQDWMARTAPWLAAHFGWMPQYQAAAEESSAPRAPQRLLARATEGYIENVYSLPGVARIRGASPEEVAEEFAMAEIAPAPQHVEWASTADFPMPEVDLDDLDRQLAALPEPDLGEDEEEEEEEAPHAPQPDQGNRDRAESPGL